MAAALAGPKGSLTVIVVNESDREGDATIELDGLATPVALSRYAVTPADRDRAEIALEPRPKIEVTRLLSDRIPAMSIIVYSTYRLAASDPGI